MGDDKLLRRVAAKRGTFGGKPMVRKHRVPVELILSLLSQGASHAGGLIEVAVKLYPLPWATRCR